ncbi:phage tail tape measure protein [Bacillus thuringiensis]|uniref:Phage tail tape measure protein, TP901 family, core region n=2 Tax=Bacillus TaxID=1386 RepID=A0A9W4A8Z8_BACTO|nr:phage tail tape measure protein [Bacillus thuringiensis]MDA2525010.1 phage tail tape measure protein [Bacillus cereus]KAB1368010.1 phage tail tape measure protein [Bacillus thuringiensis]KIP29629.1 phage-related minor tail family protein [Bacillus thuringiensis serovar morrisoni]MCT6942863.1 phage tail tape measure protein [Bacillus thuringiensis]MDA2560874.1 phage tail tape measure protein [Bacillus cereus]
MAGHEQIGVDITVNNGQAEAELRSFQQTAEQTGSKVEQAFSKIGAIGDKLTVGVTTPLAAVAALGFKTAVDFDKSQGQIQAALGVTEKGAENLNNIVKKVWKDGFGESTEEATRGLEKVYQNMRDVPHEELELATKNTLALAKTFDVDLNEATRGAGQLMGEFGLTTEETFDLLAAGAQAGLNYSDELFDNLSEYAPLFRQAGFSADEMFTILANGTANGSYNLDYINDLVKEFGIRVQDGSKGVEEAFGKLPKKTQDIWKSFNEGKATAADVFKAVIGDLKGMENQVEATQLGVSIFGVKFEDMGNQAVYSLTDVSGGLGETKGAMDKLRKAQEETFSQKWQKTLREAQLALEPLGKMLLDIAMEVLPKVSAAVKTVTEWFAGLSPEAQKTVIAIGGIALAAGPALSILGRMGGVIGGLVGKIGGFVTAARAGAAATAAVEGASGAAALGMGGLGTALGGAVIAAAPWLIGAAAIGAAGYGIYKAMTQEAVPAVDLFKDRINLAADGTVQSVTKISESTKKAVGSFMEMAQQANSATVTMFAQQTQITDENIPGIIERYNAMRDQVVNAYEQKKQSAIQKTQEAFQGVKGVTAEEQQNIMDMYNKHYELQKGKAEAARQQILDIWNKAKDEKRSITQQENEQIQKLQEVFNEQAIQAMSENKAEQEVILNNLKQSKERMNAEMLSDAVKKINETHDKTVKKAEEERDKRVKQAELMKQELGSEAEETANKLKDEANKTYEKVKDSADKTRSEGIDKLKGSYKNLEEQVDTSTGNILTYWDKIKNWWNNWTPAKKFMEVVTKGGEMDQYAPKNANGTPFFGGGLSYVNERGGEIMNLPRGTQIIPHDLSKRYIDRAADKASSNNNLSMYSPPSQPAYININLGKNQFSRFVEDIFAENDRQTARKKSF